MHNLFLTGSPGVSTQRKPPDTALLEYGTVLRYAAQNGAPLTQRGHKLLSQQRESSRTALLALSRVRKTSLIGSSRAHGAACEGVELPPDVLKTILMAAEMEIGETFGFTLQV
jgi:hypothetical protein